MMNDAINFQDFLAQDFEIQGLVGRGGFGAVYKARHLSLCQNVAIKVFEEGKNISDRTKQLVKSEAAKLGRAGHESVIRLYGICITDNFYGLVMRYAENGSLKRVLKLVDVPWSLRVRILHEIALAVNFLHVMKPPMVHADLKASNVLLDIDFRVKVSDFGLALLYHAPSSSPGRNDAGTTTHMPPESFAHDYRLNPNYDSFSFGVLLWEVITRLEPFTKTSATNPTILSDAQIQVLIERGQRPDLPSAQSTCPPEVCTLIQLMQDCWNAEANKRPNFQRCVKVLEPLKEQLIANDIDEAIKFVRSELEANKTATTLLVDEMDGLALDAAVHQTRSQYGTLSRSSPRVPIEETQNNGNHSKFGGTATEIPIPLMPTSVSVPSSSQGPHTLRSNPPTTSRISQQDSSPRVVIYHNGPLQVGDNGLINQQPTGNVFNSQPVQLKNPLLVWEMMEPRTKHKLSEAIGSKWPTLASLLGLSDVKISNIQADYIHYGVQEQAYQMFLSWYQKESRKATAQVLANALNELGRGDIVVDFL